MEDAICPRCAKRAPEDGKRHCAVCLGSVHDSGIPKSPEDLREERLAVLRGMAQAIREYVQEMRAEGADVEVPLGGRWSGTGTDGEREHRGGRLVRLL